MITLNKLRRLWQNGRYRALIREVTAGRVENRYGFDALVGGPVAAAALTLLRLCELNQQSSPLAAELRNRLEWSQARDGSWPAERGSGASKDGYLLVTALAVRALDACGGCVDAGLSYLAASQSADGRWGETDRTTPLVLLAVGRCGEGHLRIGDALAAEGRAEDAETRQAWQSARLRCGGLAKVPVAEPIVLRAETTSAQAELAFAA